MLIERRKAEQEKEMDGLNRSKVDGLSYVMMS